MTLPGLPQKERFGVHASLLLILEFGQHGGFGGFENAVQTPQHGEWQNDLAVIGLLVIAPQ